MSETATLEQVDQVLAPTRQADPSKPSLIDGLDAFFGGAPSTSEVKQETPIQKAPELVKSEPSKTEEKIEAKVATQTEELPPAIEDGFFKDGDKVEEVKDPTAFDEVAFDKQTEEEVKGMDAKAGEKFKALKAELKAAKQAAPAADLLKRVEDAELKAKEAEGLRERLKTASAASAKLEVENDDVYIKEVKEPWNATMSRLDKLSEVYEMDPSILRAIVREEDIKVQDEMIKTHLSNFTDVRRQEVFSAIPKVMDLLDKHEGYMKNAEADFGAREAKRIEETEKIIKEQRAAVKTITQDKWKRWEDKIPGLLEDGKPTTAYEKLRNESLSLDFSQSRASDQAYAAFAGTLLPFAQQQIVALQRRLAEYEKGDKKALSASPNSSSSVAQTPAEGSKPKTFMEGFLATNFGS